MSDVPEARTSEQPQFGGLLLLWLISFGDNARLEYEVYKSASESIHANLHVNYQPDLPFEASKKVVP